MPNLLYTPPLSETVGKETKQEYLRPRIALLPLYIDSTILAQSQNEGYSQQPGEW